MTSSDPRPREIWLAYVEFADRPGIGKVRPVAIVGTEGGDEVVAVKITATAGYELSEYIDVPDWESCGLRKPSRIQLNPLLVIKKDKLLRECPLGKLSDGVYAKLAKELDL